MPGDEAVERLLERAEVDRPLQPERGRRVVRDAPAVELAQQPQQLLRVRQRHRGLRLPGAGHGTSRLPRRSARAGAARAARAVPGSDRRARLIDSRFLLGRAHVAGRLRRRFGCEQERDLLVGEALELGEQLLGVAVRRAPEQLDDLLRQRRDSRRGEERVQRQVRSRSRCAPARRSASRAASGRRARRSRPRRRRVRARARLPRSPRPTPRPESVARRRPRRSAPRRPRDPAARDGRPCRSPSAAASRAATNADGIM